ncbi:hypothetical protein [Nocardiopsis sp. L17-MgMaSL7]|uniref:hypothetical protein n=1 Tax=Nocardiopsis sp. L17-MgMaSL7 TaxID=1938893 RepID=UPI000D709C09|nr:hypothetical protein [Nocardiopsis sp. L17-MgMaSL7]PWV44543.1 hypothetical protein BDW27_1232 [Nocardiopsis sp. L17-MgMaSL7]PWV44619.1 hypothetical protein BDW27_12378 [Nocardiopsis sp. L17-MgMaSL7]
MAEYKERWEYRIETSPDGLHNGQLSNLGSKGWELVSEVVVPDRKSHTGHSIRAVFKQRRS